MNNYLYAKNQTDLYFQLCFVYTFSFSQKEKERIFYFLWNIVKTKLADINWEL